MRIVLGKTSKRNATGKEGKGQLEVEVKSNSGGEREMEGGGKERESAQAREQAGRHVAASKPGN